MPSQQRIHLAVALDGAGWHPAAWTEPAARPDALFSPGYWLDLVAEAERGLLDFVTIEDALRLQSAQPLSPDRRTNQVRGRLDALLLAAHLAPRTRHIGLLPTVTVTHTEPFHVAAAIAELDHISAGRAGVRVAASASRHEAKHFGRRTLLPFHIEDRDDPVLHVVADQLIADQACELGDYVEVVRRLWDSDQAHAVEFVGRWFSVRGPSNTPRPPQGQPIVSLLGDHAAPPRLLADTADVAFVTPETADDAAEVVAAIRAAPREPGHTEPREPGRAREAVRVFADLVVFLDDDQASARARKQRLDDRDGATYVSDAPIFVGTAAQLADLLVDWHRAGVSGFRLRPGALPDDLTRITRALVPELQSRGVFRSRYEATTLRGLLGLPHPVSRYTAA